MDGRRAFNACVGGAFESSKLNGESEEVLWRCFIPQVRKPLIVNRKTIRGNPARPWPMGSSHDGPRIN